MTTEKQTHDALRAVLDAYHQGHLVPLDEGSEGYVMGVIDAGEAALAQPLTHEQQTGLSNTNADSLTANASAQTPAELAAEIKRLVCSVRDETWKSAKGNVDVHVGDVMQAAFAVINRLAALASAPNDVTPEMIEAGAKAAREYMERTGGNSPAVIYRAMRAVALASAQAQQEPFWFAVLSGRALGDKAIRSEEVAHEYANRRRELWPDVEVVPLYRAAPPVQQAEAVTRFHVWPEAYPDGMTEQDVKNEIHDYRFMLEEVPKVYDHVTGGKLTKTNYYASVITSEADAYYSELAQQAETEVRKDGKTVRKDRWEIGIRRIVALLWGNRHEFEVDDVVDAVAKLIPAPFDDGDDEGLLRSVCSPAAPPAPVAEKRNGMMTDREFLKSVEGLPAPTAEPMTRFCPGCGSVGPVLSKYRDCCPDGGKARIIPESLAKDCHNLFQLAIHAAPPAPAAEKREPLTTLAARIDELAEHHGSLRAAARVLETDASYLSRLRSGEKDDPSDLLLRRMGLRREVMYTRAHGILPADAKEVE